jgi:tRNA threonylcarbamoyladenosine biosynthesis protein TsaE
MPQDPLQISFTLADIQAAAHRLWQWAHGQRVFTFSGSLGAGKTTFIHALCDYLGVKDAVSSPTFALINEYRFPKEGGGDEQTIFHMDWYRVRDAEEAVDAGMEDALINTSAICFVEWPEKAPELLGIPHMHIQIETVGERERLLTAEYQQ